MQLWKMWEKIRGIFYDTLKYINTFKYDVYYDI